jgi:isopentenyl-diphosphate delta-isomerase
MNQVILVTESDEACGRLDKLEAHRGQGVLHRAFCILIFNNQGEVLLQQRSAQKLVWPLSWETTCASHQGIGEDDVISARNRLLFEMGLNIPLRYLGKFQYQAIWQKSGLAENEICYLMVGDYNELEIKPNPDEVAQAKWVKIAELKKELAESTDLFAPWLKPALDLWEKH